MLVLNESWNNLVHRQVRRGHPCGCYSMVDGNLDGGWAGTLRVWCGVLRGTLGWESWETVLWWWARGHVETTFGAGWAISVDD